MYFQFCGQRKRKNPASSTITDILSFVVVFMGWGWGGLSVYCARQEAFQERANRTSRGAEVGISAETVR